MKYNVVVSWTVEMTRAVQKAESDLPEEVRLQLTALMKAIETGGPVRFDWPNYGKLNPKHLNRHHCHLKKGRPTYVACWEVTNKNINLVEVYYAGTHEKSPY